MRKPFDAFNWQIIMALRKMAGQTSPMNVFPRTFTRELSIFEELHRADYEFLAGDKWQKIGSTVNVRIPQRFQISQREG